MGKVELSGEDGTMNKIVLQLQFISLICINKIMSKKLQMEVCWLKQVSKNMEIMGVGMYPYYLPFSIGEQFSSVVDKQLKLHFILLLKTMNRNILAECKRQMFKQILIFPKGIDNNISLNNPVCRQDENMTSLEYIAISYKAYY
ncbi:unnamed protein product [Paramecium primaurelia]|uniref:Uncharacterized protein n=1 Tax=Paramecium primaurelia TaxID=5886 RepID=A0A8S1JNK6_PARPR|nr:unnamed protein product [Paramecium primaurelia]